MEQTELESFYKLLGIIIGTSGAIIAALLKFFGNKVLKKKLAKAQREKFFYKNKIVERDHKIKEMKIAFKMAYGHYEEKFKTEPENMAMLKDLRTVFEN